MAQIVNSPNANVSKNYILIEQECVTKIKDAIASGKTTKEIQEIIDEYVAKMGKLNKTLARSMRTSLINFTNKARYTYLQNITTINKSIYNQIVNYESKELTRVNVEGGNQSYNVNLTGLLSDTKEFIKENPSKPIDNFRGVNTEIKNGIPMIKDYSKMVQSQLRELASETPVVAEYGADNSIKLIPLRNKVEMSVRYQANQEDVANLKSNGVKLVWTSSHASCSPRCSQWQGRLYSLDGTSGTIDGIKYTPLDEALNANGGNSIINGYNCRHYLIEYEKGSKAPKHYTESEMKKEYAIDQMQRQMENQIRNLKANAEVFKSQGNIELAEKYAKEAKIRELEYQKYSLENKRAYYPWRCSVGEDL